MIKAIAKFFRKPVIRLEIPEGNIEKIITLAADKSPLGRYKLWTLIGDLVPQTKRGGWSLDMQNATHFYVIYKGEE